MIPSRIKHITNILTSQGYTQQQIDFWFIALENRMLKELDRSGRIPLDADGHVGDLTGSRFYLIEREKTVTVLKDHGQKLDLRITLPNRPPERYTTLKKDFVSSINYKQIEFISTPE